jgi:hypothetical protein
MIPVFIIAFNNPTYVSSMVEQLLKYTSDIYIIDNCSTFPPMIKLLDETKVNVIRMPENYGHKVYQRPEIQDLIKGDFYCITDPDLTLNPKLPSNFIDLFRDISIQYQKHKVGFALDHLNNIRTDVTFQGKTITDWEWWGWNFRIDHPILEMYPSTIDTTFCLINKNYPDDNGRNHIRIAGDFLCIHRPWLTNWKEELPEDELNFYKSHATCSTWI